MTEYQVTSLSAIARNTQRRVGRMKFPEESRSRRQVLPSRVSWSDKTGLPRSMLSAATVRPVSDTAI